MKINRDKLSKYFARFGLIIMSFMIMVPMLCSASNGTYSVSYTLTNPDNIPQDITAFVIDYYSDSSTLLNIGSGSIQSGSVVNVINGSFEFVGDIFLTTVPDGYYLLCPINLTQPSGYSSTLQLVGGTSATVTFFGNTYSCYFSDSIDLVVVERDNSFQLSDFIYVFVSLPPTPTESITSVWTSIINWITSSLNTVQGLFVQGNEGTHISSVLDLDDSVTVEGTTFYNPIILVKELYYNGNRVYGADLNFVEGDGYILGYYDNVPLGYSLTPVSDNSFYYANNPLFTITPGTPVQLTFLGTLAVIGVSIALGFLIIGVIQIFLKLRG